MAIPVVNISIEQGADFTSTFTITNSDNSVYNLSSSSAVARLKKFPESITSYSFSTAITVGTGKITLTMSDDVTSTIPPGRYYYDILLTAGSGLKTRVIEGMALVTAGIST
jgi:hypothetical protein